MNETSDTGRIETGVPGLDKILLGGLLRGGVYIVEGAPGAGKTILGNQICFHRALLGESTIYLTLLAESHTRMISHLRGMEFFNPELISKSIYYISAFKVLEQDGIEGLVRSIRDAQEQRNASFLVLDGLVSAEEFAPTARDFKKFIHEIQTISSMTGATVLLLSSTERDDAYRAEQTMVDGIFELSETVLGVRSLRSITVRKMRGTAQLRGKHALEITNAGIRVRPRIESLLSRPDVEHRPERAPAPFGIPHLDEMLRGGLPGGSNTVLLGPSGSGKTVLGLQFLVAGARADEIGLYVGFYERPSAITAKGQRLGYEMADLRQRGMLHLAWEAPIEGVLDEVVERVLEQVDTHAVKRVCFDGLHGFRFHAEYSERTRAVFAALADSLARRGVTTIFTLETADLLGSRIELPIDGVSAMADNILLLRHVELRAELSRLISILKVRDNEYDARIRKLEISSRGITVKNFESAEDILTGSARPVD
jgi:circadian clock protein KaiC